MKSSQTAFLLSIGYHSQEHVQDMVGEGWWIIPLPLSRNSIHCPIMIKIGGYALLDLIIRVQKISQLGCKWAGEGYVCLQFAPEAQIHKISFVVTAPQFSDHELHDACTSTPPHVKHAQGVATSAHSFFIVPWTILLLWTLFWLWSPWCTHFGSTPCDACTTCGELCWLFFFITLNSFPTGNSYLTVNFLRQALWLCPVWCTHYVWWALLALFLLYCELFSDHELLSDH